MIQYRRSALWGYGQCVPLRLSLADPSRLYALDLKGALVTSADGATTWGPTDGAAS